MKVNMTFCSNCGAVRAYTEDEKRAQSRRCSACLQGEFLPIVAAAPETEKSLAHPIDIVFMIPGT